MPRRTHLIRAVLAGCAGTAALPAAAPAATIGHHGTTLTFRADPGERNRLVLSAGEAGGLSISDTGANALRR